MSAASATGADGDGHPIDAPNATGSDGSFYSTTNIPMGNADPSAEPKLVIQHYESESKSIGEVLDNITGSMVKFRPVHKWDEKLFVPPVKQLSAAVRKYIISERPNVDFLLAYSSVQEIISCKGVHKVYRAMAHPGDISRNLFFQEDALRVMSSEANVVESSSQTADSSATPATSPMQARAASGRIVYLDYNLQHSERAALAMLYCFCVRLHSEQLGYIYRFLKRHLSLCNTIRMPQSWQESLDPEEDTSKQRTYKRVSISCHLTYMMLTKHDTTVPAIDVLDRTAVFPFHNPDTAPSPTGIYPVRASTSIMLTVVVPELTNNAPEHVDLLRNPQGLWTVLAVNVPPGLGVDQGAHEHLTPISQYFRAISAAIVTARIHHQAILTALKDKLRSQEAGSLIDDEEFTRSNLYHWSVRTCDELQTQNAATLKFLRHTITTHVTKLHREAHSSEQEGVDHWRARLDEEIFQLDDLQSQILALKIQVQEDRNAMHQVMSVMETRAALQASERTKTLSYLATLYLPLSASASIYSMSVLPSSTTLYSFFIVLLGFFLITIMLAAYLPLMRSTLTVSIAPKLKRATAASMRITKSTAVPTYCKDIAGIVIRESKLSDVDLAPEWFHEYHRCYQFYKRMRKILRQSLIVIVHESLIYEMRLPRDKWVLMKMLKHLYFPGRWRVSTFLCDIVRFLLLPVWAVLIVAVLVYVVVLDGVVWILWLVLSTFHSICVTLQSIRKRRL